MTARLENAGSAVVHSGVSREFTKTECFNAARLESRNRSLDQSLRQATMAKSLSGFLPFRGHIRHQGGRNGASQSRSSQAGWISGKALPFGVAPF
jgi:hypothetical protein